MAFRKPVLRGMLVGTLVALSAATASAQAPDADALARSRLLSAEIEALFQQGDVAAARRKAAEASKAFAAAGEAWLAASYAVAAAEYDIRAGDARRIDAETYPRLQELLGVLDPVDTSRGDTLVELLMDAKGMLGEADKQVELAALYESRAAKAHGEDSEAALAARIRASFSLMQGGRFDDGYKRLRAALIAAARMEHYAFTIGNYGQAAEMMHRNGLNQQASELYACPEIVIT